LAETCNAFLRPLKKKGCKEERVTSMRLDNRSTSTPLESNKSQSGIVFFFSAYVYTLLRYVDHAMKEAV
jgi:hypothetical protein